MAKTNRKSTRRRKEVPLEVKAGEVILNGGSYVTRGGRVITSANVPRSYSEAIRSGLYFYVHERS
jgi:hypothetical protein